MSQAAIEVRGLRKSFGEKEAVAGIDLDIAAGSLAGLVGPNGAGKTTSLSMMTGLLRPDAGQVLINGLDVWADPVAAKAVIGVVPAEARLFERLSGEEMLEYAGRLRGLPAAEARCAGRAAAGRAGPDRRRQAAGRRLLHRHAQEDHARLRPDPQPVGAVPGRAAGGRGPDLRRRDPPAADALRRLRLDRAVLQPRHGAGRAGLRPRIHHRQGQDRGHRHHRRRCAAARPCSRRSSTWSARGPAARRDCHGSAPRPAEAAPAAQRAALVHGRQGLLHHQHDLRLPGRDRHLRCPGPAPRKSARRWT